MQPLSSNRNACVQRISPSRKLAGRPIFDNSFVYQSSSAKPERKTDARFHAVINSALLAILQLDGARKAPA